MSRRVLITDFFSKDGTKTKKPKVLKKNIENVTVTKKDTKNDEQTVSKEPINQVKIDVKDQLGVKPIEKQENGESGKEEHKSETNDSIDNSPKKYDEFCKKHNFNKSKWVESLSPEQRELLNLEIENLHITWLAFLHKELTKPYFLQLKKFLKSQQGKTIYPPENQIYSWSQLTPLPDVKCLIIGQDPYHGPNQAHGLAFSVLEPTRPPPSLVNIYKTINNDYPDFKVPDPKKQPGGGNLTKWAKRGVLMLNAVLTVEAHKANSHANQGWEEFTENVIKNVLEFHKNDALVIMAWGSPAQKRVAKFSIASNRDHFLVLKTVHPSPLSAYRGFFDLKVFIKCNKFLHQHHKDRIDWGLLDGNVVK